MVQVIKEYLLEFPIEKINRSNRLKTFKVIRDTGGDDENIIWCAGISGRDGHKHLWYVTCSEEDLEVLILKSAKIRKNLFGV